MKIEAKNSMIDTIGFAKPPVVPVDKALVATVPICIVPEEPPPAMVARVHFRAGSTSPITAADIIVPAITAEGVAMVSSRLSSHGIRYARTSKITAALRIPHAVHESRYAKSPVRSTQSWTAAKLNAAGGKKIRNPHAADNPSPTDSASRTDEASISIFILEDNRVPATARGSRTIGINVNTLSKFTFTY